MAICTDKNNNAGYMTLILVFSFLIGASQAFCAEVDPNAPIIGKNKDSLAFRETAFSRSFQIWNEGGGILNYRLDINGTDANQFTIDDANIGDDVNGQSVGIDDIKTHWVDANYGQLVDVTLIARVVITDINDGNNVSYINLTAYPSEPNGPEESHGPSTSQTIGKSSGRIGLAGNVISKRFQIWNKGTGTLNYTLSLAGDDADYFTLDSEDGQSEKLDDKQTHTVYVDYEDLHNTTLYAWIEITDNNDNISYIDLSATETAATRVFYISIEQGINYQDDDEVNDFRLYIETDDTVEEVNFTTAEGKECFISDYSESDDGGIRYWTYPEEPEGDIDFAEYGDGTYTIGVTYDDDDVAATTVNFGIFNRPGTITWPMQMPVLTWPEYEGQAVSPIRLEWEKCLDVNVNAIRLVLAKSCEEGDCNSNSIERQYSKRAVRSAAIDLEPGWWDTELSFGRWYQGENDDGIEFEVGKCTRSQNAFEIMKWFGTDINANMINHPLKLTDCNGTEVTFKLTGGGKGAITSEDCALDGIELTGTTDKSVLSISTKRGVKTSVGDIKIISEETNGDIKAIVGRNVNLEGNIEIDGGVSVIILNNVVGDEETGREISIGSPPESLKITTCALTFGQIDNLILKSSTPIRSLRATNWLNGSLDAPWISTMTIKGDFGADVTIGLGADENPKGVALKSAKIAGELAGIWSVDGNCGTIAIASSDEIADVNVIGDASTINVIGNKKAGLPAVLSGDWYFGSVKAIKADTISLCEIGADGAIKENIPDIGNITVKRWIADSTINSTGDIGSIKAGAIRDCNVLTAMAPVGRVMIKGIKNEAFCFINSNIEAGSIGTAYIGYPKYFNGGTPFGVKANSIDKLTLKDSSRKTTWTDLEPGDANAPTPIEDFQIVLQ